MDLINAQGYSNTYPTAYAVKPRQPIFGQYSITDTEIFQYDLITPYGVLSAVSNSDNNDLYMVGWGMIVTVSLVAPAAGTLTIQADPTGSGVYAEIDTSPVIFAASAKLQTFRFGPISACFIRGRLAGDGSVYRYHVSLTDY